MKVLATFFALFLAGNLAVAMAQKVPAPPVAAIASANPPRADAPANAPILNADGVILVVRAGQTTTESALLARQRFAEDGTRVLGTVLNGWDPKASGHYGYGAYTDYKAYAAQSSE